LRRVEGRIKQNAAKSMGGGNEEKLAIAIAAKLSFIKHMLTDR